MTRFSQVHIDHVPMHAHTTVDLFNNMIPSEQSTSSENDEAHIAKV